MYIFLSSICQAFAGNVFSLVRDFYVSIGINVRFREFYVLEESNFLKFGYYRSETNPNGIELVMDPDPYTDSGSLEIKTW